MELGSARIEGTVKLSNNDWVGNDCDEGTFSSKEGRGAIDGIPFTYGYTDTHETDDNRDSFSVSIESPAGKEFGIRRETVFDLA